MNRFWTKVFVGALNKSAEAMEKLALDAGSYADLCLLLSGGEDDGGFSEVAMQFYAMADMAYDLQGGCVEGGPCCHPCGPGGCEGFQEGSCGCAWNR